MIFPQTFSGIIIDINNPLNIEIMKKNAVFSFTSPEGEEVMGVCVGEVAHTGNTTICLGYAQNRLFLINVVDSEECYTEDIGDTIVDNCVLPEYDRILEWYV